MSQHYSDPKREDDPHALPNVETFYIRESDTLENRPFEGLTAGWYYWYCFPGCLPDSEPNGPFDTEEDALQDIRDNDYSEE